jgi:hypothetical protein
LLLVLASAIILESQSYGTHDHVLLSQIRDSFKLGGQVPVFISPKNRVAQLYSQALGYTALCGKTDPSFVEENAPFRNTYVSRREQQILVMYL